MSTGALVGCAAGALAGSVMPGVGTAIGCVAGAISAGGHTLVFWNALN
ncbi:hypothetical protein [Arenimonas daejeonensis]|nr:hypothetical protein [Arenimonas daejeonensis]